MFPLLCPVTVISRDAKAGKVSVLLDGGQVIPVQMSYHGMADAVRISKRPLPKEGTRGLVAFAYGAAPNGTWLCSIYGQKQDAIPNDTDPDCDYDSHPGGGYSMLDGKGNLCRAFPDGSFFTLGAAATKPVISRHVVDATQKQITQVFHDHERNANTIAPMQATLSMASGSLFNVDASGNVTVSVPATAELTIQVGSGSSMTINSDSVTINSPVTNIVNNLTVGTGVTGTFTTPLGDTVTVTSGIITNID